MSDTQEKRCGTCRHFSESGYRRGPICKWAINTLSEAVVDALRLEDGVPTSSFNGRACPTWEAYERT